MARYSEIDLIIQEFKGHPYRLDWSIRTSDKEVEQYLKRYRRPVSRSLCNDVRVNTFWRLQKCYEYYNSRSVDDEELETLAALLRPMLAKVGGRLDNYTNVTHPPLSPVLTKEEMGLLDRLHSAMVNAIRSSGAKRRPQYQRIMLRKLKTMNLEARKNEIVSRIVWQFDHCITNGWYPVFVTLTVSPEHMETVFCKGSKAYQTYIRRVRREIAKRLGYTKKETQGKDIHHAIGVVERGDKTGRLHIHVLHYCRVLPVDCSDPNKGRSIPDLRELTAWRALWPYGFVSAVACRISASDIYAREGWNWPVVLKEDGTYEPYKTAGPLGVGRYLGKYLGKSYENGDLWRCRMTRNFGTKEIQTIIQKKTRKELWKIVTQPIPKILHLGRPINQTMIKRIAMKVLIKRYPTIMLRKLAHLEPGLSLTSLMDQQCFTIPNMRSTDDFRWLSSEFRDPVSVPVMSGMVHT